MRTPAPKPFNEGVERDEICLVCNKGPVTLAVAMLAQRARESQPAAFTEAPQARGCSLGFARRKVGLAGGVGIVVVAFFNLGRLALTRSRNRIAAAGLCRPLFAWKEE
jgi:hypothetical protein